MKVTHNAIRRKLASSAIILSLTVLGVYGLWRLPVDYLPNVTYPLIKLQIRWPGATPEELETEIADPVERFVATADKLDYLESSMVEGLYSLDAHFQYGADIDVAFQDVLAALTRAEQHLPDDIEAPYVFKADPSQLPVIQLTVSSDRWKPVTLRDWTENWLQDKILAVQGVAGTEVIGGLVREIQIHLDPQAMEKYQLSLEAVIKRIAAENTGRSGGLGGRITAGSREIIVRTLGEFTNLEEIQNVILTGDTYQKVYLKDIADVKDSHDQVRMITRFNGEESVKLSVHKEAESNTVLTAERVKQLLTSLEDELPQGVELDYMEDQAFYVKQALQGVQNAAIAAVILLILVIYLFLGSYRQVLVMIIALPLTLILNFGLMKISGFTLNIFSLGGLVIAIGVILDNSIVVVENISRLRRDHPEEEIEYLAETGTQEVGPALIAATLSFMALFVPFLIVPGMTSLLFRELILVIAGIVIISLTVAVTVTPMMMTLLFHRKKQTPSSSWFEKLFERFTSAYGRFLKRVLIWRWKLIAGFLTVIVLAVFLFRQTGGEFLPLIDDGRIIIKVKMSPGTSVNEINRVLKNIEDRIEDEPAIQSIFSLAGGQLKGLTTYELAHEGELNLQLVPKSKRTLTTEEYVQHLRKMTAPFRPPGGNIMVRQMPIKGIRMGGSDVEVQVRGQDIDLLTDLANRTAQTMNSLNIFRNVTISMDPSKPEYQVVIDRTKAGDLGLSVSDISNSLHTLITGTVLARYRDKNEFYNIRLRVPEKQLTSRQDVEKLPISGTGGNIVRIGDIASVIPATGPVEIIRENQVKKITVEADIAEGSLSGAVKILEKALEELDRPAGYLFDFGGRVRMMNEMTETVVAVIFFALFFSFIVLTVQFNSLKLPGLILISVPVSLTGAVYLIYLTGLSMGATVIIGILVVIAATVNDGVLLFSYAGDLEKTRGISPGLAVTEAAAIRLRPRIMTSVTTMVGFIPLALNLAEGGDMLQPMAVAAIGGLIMEIPVALILMPLLYVVVSKNPGFFKKL